MRPCLFERTPPPNSFPPTPFPHRTPSLPSPKNDKHKNHQDTIRKWIMYVYMPAYQKTYDITIHLIASWPWTPTLKNETSPLSQVLCIAMYIGFAFFFLPVLRTPPRAASWKSTTMKWVFFSSESRGLLLRIQQWSGELPKQKLVQMVTQMLQNSDQFWRGLLKTNFQKSCN